MSNILDSLKVIIGLEGKGFSRVQHEIAGFAKSAQGTFGTLKAAVAGYFTVDVVKSLMESGLQFAAHVNDISEQFGIARADVQRYDAAAEAVGLTVDNVAAAFDKLASMREKALGGDTGALQTFNKFGVSEADLNNLKTSSELFQRIAKYAGDASDATTRAQWKEIFGKSGAKLIEMARDLEHVDVKIITDDDLERLHKAERMLAAIKKDMAVTAAGWMASILPKDLTSPNESQRKNLREQARNIVTNRKNYSSQVAWQAVWFQEQERKGLVSDEQLNQWGEKFAAWRAGKEWKPLSEAKKLEAPKPLAPELSSKDRIKYERELQESVAGMFTKLANPEQKRGMIQEEITRLKDEIPGFEKSGDFASAQANRKRLVGLAGELAGTYKAESNRIPTDTAAAIGGYIGGAAANLNPMLLAQQDLVSLARRILDAVDVIKSGDRDLSMRSATPKP